MSPVVTTFDSSVPGGKKAKVRVTNDTIGPLRQRVRQILDLGGRGGHLTVVVNPTAVPTGCEAGDGRVCLRLVRQANVPFAESIVLLPGLPTVQYDPNRVTLPGQPGAFNLNALELIGLDLTPRLPSGVIDQFHNLYSLTRILPAPNSELRLAFHPDKLEIAGHRGNMGLWLPATLSAVAPEGGSTVSNHICDDSATPVSTLPGICGDVLKKMNDGIRAAAGNTDVFNFACHRLEFSLELRRFHLWFGIVPETPQGCDPLAQRWDLEWMMNAPEPHQYRQGCLRTRGELHVVVDAEPKLDFFPNQPGDLLFSAEVKSCSSLVQAACATVVDCPAKTKEIAEQQLEKLLPQRMRDSLNEQLGPMFGYQGPPGSPYTDPTPPGPCQGTSDPNCQQAIRAHHLPASLTRLTYGWLANAFASFETSPQYQYPVTEILDQVSGPKGVRARLVRVDPTSGRRESLGEWPRAGLFEQHFLRTELDGSVLLVASSPKHHAHALVRFVIESGKLRPTGFRMRSRALGHPPVVDTGGYWLLTTKQKGQLEVERFVDLPLVPVSDHAQIGQCW